MKELMIVLMLAGLAAAATTSYTTKYDNINLDEILNNERLYRKYFECLKGAGKCTPDGKELKELLPDALETDCSKCSEKQKAGSEKVLRFLLEKKPDDYAELEKIYDPQGTYKKKYQEEFEKQGFKL
uniref:Chemosensory protein 7 n=1 Tax=Riptortus pedestris TaxID=329032 RepID=A0A2Z4HQ07_RIPPE|nr:chemosensory protein 7 [Riptortus pedestris]